MTAAELSDCLGLHAIKSHPWTIVAACALTGDGLQTGLAWIAQHVSHH